VARYYTPSGRSIQEKGIAPDWSLRGTGPQFGDDDGAREQSLPGHFKAEEVAADPDGGPRPALSPSALAAARAPGDPQDDAQLQAALGALRSWPAVRTRFPALK
jgi:carboxyl-terminal processing protease